MIPYSYLLSLLATFNIAVIEKPYCAGSDIAGRYFFGDNVICLSTSVRHSKYDTLVHEAVHAAQDCAGGGLHTGRYASAISGQSTNKDAIESEARNLERDPIRVVRLLQARCS